MKILLDKQREELIANHNKVCVTHSWPIMPAIYPVVKLFVCVGGNATWLLTELDPETNIAFGLCDLGHGFPELGYVDLTELEDTMDWRLERDRHWTPDDRTIGQYAIDARAAGMIVA